MLRGKKGCMRDIVPHQGIGKNGRKEGGGPELPTLILVHIKGDTERTTGPNRFDEELAQLTGLAVTGGRTFRTKGGTRGRKALIKREERGSDTVGKEGGGGKERPMGRNCRCVRGRGGRVGKNKGGKKKRVKKISRSERVLAKRSAHRLLTFIDRRENGRNHIAQ